MSLQHPIVPHSARRRVVEPLRIKEKDLVCDPMNQTCGPASELTCKQALNDEEDQCTGKAGFVEAVAAEEQVPDPICQVKGHGEDTENCTDGKPFQQTLLLLASLTVGIFDDGHVVAVFVGGYNIFGGHCQTQAAAIGKN